MVIPGAVSAAGALIHYLRATQKVDPRPCASVSFRSGRIRC